MTDARLIEAFTAMRDYLQADGTVGLPMEAAILNAIECAIAVLERPVTLKEKGIASMQEAMKSIDRAVGGL